MIHVKLSSRGGMLVDFGQQAAHNSAMGNGALDRSFF